MKKYRMVEVIGDGTYGTVWKGIYLETGEKVAIKKLKNKIKSWQECIELKEVKALSKLKTHPNVIKLKEVIRETNSEVFFVFEYADTNLYEFVENIKRKGDNLSEFKIKEIIYQLALGLMYIHSNGYFHRDLKPENILIMSNNSSDNITVKIADFGLAKEIPGYYNNIPLTDYVCTRWYRSPECILKSTNYSSAMDVWALGCILCELYMLRPIFPGNSEFDQLTRVINVLGAPKFNDWPEGYKLIQKLGMKFSISSGIQLSSVLNCSNGQVINLLYDLFNWDPLMRPNCQKIISHPYFDDIRSQFNNKNDVYNSKPASNYAVNNYNSNSNYTTGLGNEDYLNNFNYKNYRNNNNYVPEVNSNPYGTYNINTNYNSNYNRDKYKLSNLAENEMKFSKYSKINNLMYGLGETKNDYYSNIITNSNNNFYYDVNLNKNITNENNTKKYNYKSDLESNGLSSNTYTKSNLFNYPQIFI